MKTVLKVSVCVNVGLLGGLVFVLMHGRKEETQAAAPALSDVKPAVETVRTPVAPARQAIPEPFHWSQLVANDYRAYVANLRAIGCPDSTVRDIVRGDVERTFSFERNELGLDGSGTGPWSEFQEARLMAGLLGDRLPVARTDAAGQNQQDVLARTSGQEQNVKKPARQNSGEGTPEFSAGAQNAEQPSFNPNVLISYPLAFQDFNVDARGLDADQKAAIEEARQQFIDELGGPNQNPADPGYAARWQKAQGDADDTLRGLLGTRGYMAYQQELYYEWYQPQVVAAGSSGNQQTIHLGSFPN